MVAVDTDRTTRGGAAGAGRDSARAALGRYGENLAARHLSDAGLRVLERNWRCREGEIDIVARDGRTLVFCEVKTRVEDNPTPEDQVNKIGRAHV